jgi:hypothetical protein
MATVVIAISKVASYNKLKEELQGEAKKRNFAERKLAQRILTYALAHKSKYTGPLSRFAGEGEGFECNSTTEEREKLREWANEADRKLGAHCAYLLAKTIENGDLAGI